MTEPYRRSPHDRGLEPLPIALVVIATMFFSLPGLVLAIIGFYQAQRIGRDGNPWLQAWIITMIVLVLIVIVMMVALQSMVKGWVE